VLRKARVFALILTRGQIAIDPRDWFVDKLNHGHLLRKLVNDAWREEAAAGLIATEASWFENSFRIGLAKSGLDRAHINPGGKRMFARRADRADRGGSVLARRLGRRDHREQAAFYDAVEIVYRAAIALAGRFAALARRMIGDYPEHAERLRAIAETCERVPAHGPQTFHQALQFHWLMHQLIELEGELVRSAGHFDRVFYPYYRADLDAGRLTREQAIELIQFFWFKHFARTRGKDNGKNFVLGGQDGLGRDATNELTW
jgi:formate C-acetyltransferase